MPRAPRFPARRTARCDRVEKSVAARIRISGPFMPFQRDRALLKRRSGSTPDRSRGTCTPVPHPVVRPACMASSKTRPALGRADDRFRARDTEWLQPKAPHVSPVLVWAWVLVWTCSSPIASRRRRALTLSDARCGGIFPEFQGKARLVERPALTRIGRSKACDEAVREE